MGWEEFRSFVFHRWDNQGPIQVLIELLTGRFRDQQTSMACRTMEIPLFMPLVRGMG
jgi:hypothetical protein